MERTCPIPHAMMAVFTACVRVVALSTTPCTCSSSRSVHAAQPHACCFSPEGHMFRRRVRHLCSRSAPLASCGKPSPSQPSAPEVKPRGIARVPIWRAAVATQARAREVRQLAAVQRIVVLRVPRRVPTDRALPCTHTHTPSCTHAPPSPPCTHMWAEPYTLEA